MGKAFFHHLKYINWRQEAEFKNVKNEEFKNKVIELRDNGGFIPESNTIRMDFPDGAYKTDKKGSYRHLYFREHGRYYHWSTNIMDDNKNTGMINNAGRRSITYVQGKFKEQYNCTMQKAFGYVEGYFKKCIPKSFIYISEKYLDKELFSVSQIDGCSQYPSNLCGTLPDAHGMKEIQGTVKPTAEYPFAFYLKSGHSAEYGRYDTHNWKNSIYYSKLFNYNLYNPTVEEDEDITVLMKKSKYNFNQIMEELYNLRKVDASAKLALNSTIGYFHTTNYKEYKLAHLAVVCIARSNQKILEKCEEIGTEKIIHICVDGIMYIGSKIYGSEKKEFGKFVQEFSDCRCYIRGTNAYIVMDDDNNVIKCKHGAYNFNVDGTPIADENIKSIKDCDKWIKVDYFESKEFKDE